MKICFSFRVLWIHIIVAHWLCATWHTAMETDTYSTARAFINSTNSMSLLALHSWEVSIIFISLLVVAAHRIMEIKLRLSLSLWHSLCAPLEFKIMLMYLCTAMTNIVIKKIKRCNEFKEIGMNLRNSAVHAIDLDIFRRTHTCTHSWQAANEEPQNEESKQVKRLTCCGNNKATL